MSQIPPKSKSEIARETLAGWTFGLAGVAIVVIVAWSALKGQAIPSTIALALIGAGVAMAFFGGFVANKKASGEYMEHAKDFLRIWKGRNGGGP